MILDEIVKNPKVEEQEEKIVNEESNNSSSSQENKSTQNQDADKQEQPKKLNKKLINKINNDLISKNLNLEIEISKLREKLKTYENDFKTQIHSFEEKGNQKVKELKEELHKKFEEEAKILKLYGAQSFFEDFLSPFLNLKTAIDFGSNSNDPNVSNYVKGFSMLFAQLEAIMENFGITKIEPKVGDVYDSNTQQIYQLEVGEKDIILKIQSIGFKLHERVIKPALVIVGKNDDK